MSDGLYMGGVVAFWNMEGCDTSFSMSDVVQCMVSGSIWTALPILGVGLMLDQSNCKTRIVVW